MSNFAEFFDENNKIEINKCMKKNSNMKYKIYGDNHNMILWIVVSVYIFCIYKKLKQIILEIIYYFQKFN